MLGKLSISQKLWLMAVVSILGLLVVISFSISLKHEQMMEDRKDKIYAITVAGQNAAKHFNTLVAQGEFSQEEAQVRLFQALHGMIYDDGAGYFFIITMEGVTIFNPGSPNAVGVDLNDLPDKKGNLFLQDLAAAAQRGGDFVTYYWNKPGQPENQFFPKMAYAAEIPGWDAYIGTGLYIDDIEQDTRALVWDYVVISLVVISLIIIATALVAREITRALGAMADSMDRIAAGETGVTIQGQSRRDVIGRMAKAVQALQKT